MTLNPKAQIDRKSTPQHLIGVVDTYPARRYGLVTALSERGYDVCASFDTRKLKEALEPGISPSTLVYSCDDGNISSIGSIHLEWPDAPIVALLAQASVINYRKALHVGAIAVLSLYAELEEIAHAVEGAISGLITLPRRAAEAVARTDREADSPSLLNDREIVWLHHLARGTTVTKLAGVAGYSERAMYRQLSLMYRKLGVQNRTQALLLAAQYGLLNWPDP
jgi:DNA-binding NarL/FixJ family response regulator